MDAESHLTNTDTLAPLAIFRITPAMSLLCLKVGVVAFIQATLKRENASIFTLALRP
jgi:hypothetical protein